MKCPTSIRTLVFFLKICRSCAIWCLILAGVLPAIGSAQQRERIQAQAKRYLEAEKLLHGLHAVPLGLEGVDAEGNVLTVEISDPDGDRLNQLAQRAPQIETLVIRIQSGRLSSEGLRQLDKLPELRCLWYLADLTDDSAEAISHLTKLTELHIFSDGLTERGAQVFSRLTSLETLNLGVGFDKPSAAADKVGADILRQLPHLKSLTLHNAGVSSLTMRELGHLRELRSLFIHGGRNFSSGDFRHLQNLTRLEELEVQSSFSEEAAASLASLTSLKSLRGLGSLTAEGMRHLSGLTNLEQLWIRSDEITDESLMSLSDLTNLEDLNLDCPKITGSGFRHLADLDRLRRLMLRHTNFQPENLRYLTALTALEEIDLGWTPMGDEANWQSLTVLRALPNLKELQVEGLDRRLDLFETLLPGVQNTYIE